MKYTLYIGSYGDDSIAHVTMTDGKLRLAETFEASNASYLCMSPNGKHLYAVGESQHLWGEMSGSVQSYDIAENGRLTQTSIQPTRGANTCHLTLIGNLLLVSNYDSGSLSRFTVEEDGRIGQMLPLIAHSGCGPNPERQEGPHIHQALLTPNGWLAVTDLGLDGIFFYPAPEITADVPAAIKVSTPAGFGPRHCAFLRNSDVWYALCELESQLLIYRGAPGSAVLIGRVPIGDGDAPDYPSALRLSPDQRLLAATGRGQNVIALFAIGENGLPARLTEVSSRGDWPRDVQFSPDGEYLVCANQRSNAIVAFALKDGRLEFCSELHIHDPACVLFNPLRMEE